MKVLLSIKPEFVERIFDGSKKYEYRKMLFKRNDINVVVIYASAPVKRVVGEFRIKDILLLDTFFNPIQKYFIRYKVFTPKEKVLKILMVTRI